MRVKDYRLRCEDEGVDGNIWVVCFKKVVHAKKLSLNHKNDIILFPKKKINIYVKVRKLKC